MMFAARDGDPAFAAPGMEKMWLGGLGSDATAVVVTQAFKLIRDMFTRPEPEKHSACLAQSESCCPVGILVQSLDEPVSAETAASAASRTPAPPHVRCDGHPGPAGISWKDLWSTGFLGHWR